MATKVIKKVAPKVVKKAAKPVEEEVEEVETEEEVEEVETEEVEEVETEEEEVEEVPAKKTTIKKVTTTKKSTPAKKASTKSPLTSKKVSKELVGKEKLTKLIQVELQNILNEGKDEAERVEVSLKLTKDFLSAFSTGLMKMLEESNDTDMVEITPYLKIKTTVKDAKVYPVSKDPKTGGDRYNLAVGARRIGTLVKQINIDEPIKAAVNVDSKGNISSMSSKDLKKYTSLTEKENNENWELIADQF